jgi:hypothetical protein
VRRIISGIVGAAVTIVLLVAGVALLVDGIATYFLRLEPFLFSSASDSALDQLGLLLFGLVALSVGVLRSFALPWLLVGSRNPYLVTSIDDTVVELTEGSPYIDRRVLRRLGGRRSFLCPWVWHFATSDDESLARCLGTLRDLGVVFEGINPAGWSAADVAEWLRERGLVSGPFQEIVYVSRGPLIRPR